MCCKETTKEPCIEQDCSCPIKDLSTDCSLYTGEDLECSGIKGNTNLTEVLQMLDEFICTKFNEAINYFQLVNIGDGAKLYKGINLVGAKEIRSLTKTGDLIVITENSNDVSITIDEAELSSFIEGNQKLYEAANTTEEEAAVYKDTTVTGDTSTFNFRTLKSDTLVITENEDDITIETNVVELTDFIVDTRFSAEDYDEKGTYAKPYKNLDNAIIAYIGTGTRHNPEFIGSRILCIGGTFHTFTENLSIRGLILEIEEGTIVRYVGADKYPIDFEAIQTSLGGYGLQSGNINIILKGKGTLITNNLLANVVNSGHTISDLNRYSNVLNIEGLSITSLYKEDEFLDNIVRSDASEWISNTRPAKFYFGTVDEAMIKTTGQNTTDPIADNGGVLSCSVNDSTLLCISQQIIESDSTYVALKDTILRNSYFSGGYGYVIADDGALVGTTLTEDPPLSYNLPAYKEDLCLIKQKGSSQVIIEGGVFNSGREITIKEAYYILEDDNCVFRMFDGLQSRPQGAENAEYFINIDGFNPIVELYNVKHNKTVNPISSLINSTLTPYQKAVVDGCNVFINLADNIDLTKNNTISVTNVFQNKTKESLMTFPDRPSAITAGLSSGDIFVNRKIIDAGDFVIGEEYVINTIGDTDFTLIGASSNTEGEHFTATGAGVGTGDAYYYKRDIIL